MKNKILFTALAFMLFVLNGFVILSPEPALTDIDVVSDHGQTEIIVKTNCKVEPVIEIEKEHSAIRIDFIGLKVGSELVKKALSGEFVSLGYLINYSGRSPVTGLRVFPRKGGLKSVRQDKEGYRIIFSEVKEIASFRRRSSETLFSPKEERFSPVSLSLHEAPSLPLMLELAGKAGIDIRFSQDIPETISINLEAASPIDALKAIAAEIGGRIEQNGKFWWIYGAKS
ncbi:MAG: hypothetical protein ACOYXC_06990 [Candidatus Rifleibacteriota bacterium]